MHAVGALGVTLFTAVGVRGRKLLRNRLKWREKAGASGFAEGKALSADP